MGNYVAFLNELGLEDIPDVGGKGANLGELLKAGLRVPDGFCVKCESFDTFLDENRLNDPIQKIVLSIDYSDIKDVQEKSARVREMVSRAPTPPRIRDEILNAYEILSENGKPPLVAVRSSVATRDLSRSSLPGQMDTYHNVRGADKVLKLVRECWASVWTARAINTLNAKGINYQNVVIAPVVQLMVPSEIAGVLFTSNPLTGSENELIIDAGYGLGEAIVSGKITPDNFIVCKKSKEILKSTAGYKQFKYECDPELESGNRTIELPEDQREKLCITTLQIQELAELGIKIEKYYKYPQDVEWAFSKGKLYLLQSRKIIGMGKPSKQDYVKPTAPVPNNPENIWSRQGGDEFMADYVMPLSHFFLVEWIDQYANKEMAELFGRRDLADVPTLRRHNGYMYVSGLYFRKFFQFIPRNARTMDMINWFPEAFRDKMIAEPFRIDFLLKTLGIFFKDHRVLLKNNQRALKQHILNIKKYIIPKLQQDYSGLTQAQWHREQDEVEEYGREHFRTIRYGLLYNQTFVSILSGLLQKWCGDKDGTMYQQMISGFPETKTAEVNRNIYKLSMTARADRDFSSILLDRKRIYTEIREITETHTFWQKFDAFITEHGHRCASRELAFPRWWEKPEIVIGFIRAQLQAEPPPPDPEILEAESIKKREEAEQTAILKAGQGKGGWLRRKVLTWVINKNRDFMIYRENQRYFLDAIIARSRALILEQGRRLTDAGVLKDPSEVFYLEKVEFEALLKKPHPSPQIRLKIEERRKHHEEWKNKLPALYLYDDVEVDDDPADSCRTIQPDSGEGNYVASGLPAVQGKVRAPARVVTSLEQLDQIKQGEILITINTDPGWTCVFPMLAGLVTETGGLLSHGAILARDYGIPAVMGVRGVTSAIRTGEMVTIDGLKGEIRKL